MTKIDVMKRANELERERLENWRKDYFAGMRTALNTFYGDYKTAYGVYYETAETLERKYKGCPPADLVNDNERVFRENVQVIADHFKETLAGEYDKISRDIEKRFSIAETDLSETNVNEYMTRIELSTTRELMRLLETAETLEPYKVRVLEREIERRPAGERANLSRLLSRFSQERGNLIADLNAHYSAFETISGVKRNLGNPHNYGYITRLEKNAGALGLLPPDEN